MDDKASTNGIEPANTMTPSDSTSSLGKRKRDGMDNNVAAPALIANNNSGSPFTQQPPILKNVILLIDRTKYAPPSFLDYVFPIKTNTNRANAKRTKLLDGAAQQPDTTTIRARINAGFYKSIEDFKSDIDHIKSLIKHSNSPTLPTLPDGGVTVFAQALSIVKYLDNPIPVDGAPEPVDNTSRNAAIQAVNGHWANDNTRDQMPTAAAGSSTTMDTRNQTPSVAAGSSTTMDIGNDDIQSKQPNSAQKNTLTLYGQGHGMSYPAQMFSSLQQPTLGETESGFDYEWSHLRDNALPNGITAARHLHYAQVDTSRDDQTFADRFCGPPTLPTVPPPAPSRHTTTRSTSVGWYNPEDAEPTSSIISTPQGPRTNYRQARLEAGKWIATSHGSSQTTEKEGSFQANIKDLWKCYGGGSNITKDNTNAVVHTDEKEAVWWQTKGQYEFERHFPSTKKTTPDFAIDPRLDTTPALNDYMFDEQSMLEFRPDAPPREIQSQTGSRAEEREAVKEREGSIDEKLARISELLQQLIDLQRNRKLERAPTSRNQMTAFQVGNAEPDQEELDTVKLVQLNLALMIESLLPHEVARFDGDMLQSLNIKPTIVTQNSVHSGILEDPDIKPNNPNNEASQTMPTRTGYPTTPRVPYPSATPSQYNPQRGYNQTPSARPGQTYTPLHYPGRPSSSTHYPAGQPQGLHGRQPQTPSTLAQRPPYSQNQYPQSAGHHIGHQPQRPVQNGYHNPPPNGSTTPAVRPMNTGYGQQTSAVMSPTKLPGYAYTTPTNANSQPRYFQQQYGISSQIKPPDGPTVGTRPGEVGGVRSQVAAAGMMGAQRQQQNASQQMSMRQGSGTPQPNSNRPLEPRSATPGGQSNGTGSSAVKNQ